MSSLAVGFVAKEKVQKAPLKRGRDEEDVDYSEFETEVLYARIDELEKKKNAYKYKLQQVKCVVQSNYEEPEKMRNKLIKLLCKTVKKKKSVSDLEIKNAISNIVIID